MAISQMTANVALSVLIAMVLIALLIIRQMMSVSGKDARRRRSRLDLVIVPLAITFVIIVVARALAVL